MKAKRYFCASAMLFGLLMVVSALQAVDAVAIDKIRAKGVLDDDDLRTIDRFVGQSIQELVKSTDFTSVSRIRAGIVSRAGSTSESSASQYAQQFIESVHKHLAAGLEEAANIAPEELRFRATLNLLILADELGNVRLVDLALGQLDSKNETVRYWAVRCVTNPQVLKQLKEANPSDHSKLAAQIIERLKGSVDTASPETITVVTEFADKTETPQADALLLQIADMRIKKYAGWAVTDEFVDVTVLGALSDRMSTDRGNDQFGRKFAQLYSYAIQRYIANIKGGNFLSPAEKDQLATVLVETEKSFIGKFLSIQQTTIKRAVETDDYVALWQEHNRLLGDESKTGEFPEKLKFDYGDKRIYPLMLSERPEPQKSE
jgi:hypothetical protein